MMSIFKGNFKKTQLKVTLNLNVFEIDKYNG